MIVFVGKWLSTREGNLMIYNLILAFLSEIIIILATRNGIGTHPDRIMIGIVMLLISGLGTTNGFRELLQRDFISGSINILNSILGATGIALGIALCHDGLSCKIHGRIYADTKCSDAACFLYDCLYRFCHMV